MFKKFSEFKSLENKQTKFKNISKNMNETIVQYYETLPDFANDENRQLHAINKQKGAQYEALDNDCKDLEERHKVLKDHLHNVLLEVKSVEQLVIEKEKQAEEEKHLQQLAERERGKIRVDYEKAEKEMEDVQSKWSILQGKIQIAQNRVDNYKEEMQINQKQLEQWQAAAKQKEEDFQVIKQYEKDDQGKIKGLIMQKEKCAILVDEKKAELEQEITTTKSLQIELDETAGFFRKIHEERARLLAQWEEALKQVRAMDERIETAQTSYDSRRGEGDKHRVVIAEDLKNFDLAESRNKQIERQLVMLDHQVGQKQQIVKTETEQLLEFREVVATQRQKLDKCESDIRAYTEHIQDYQNKIAKENARKDDLRQRLGETQDAFDLQKDYTKDITQQTDIMNEFYKKEEAKIKELDKSIDEEKKRIYLLSQEVFQLRKDEKTIIAEIEGSQSRSKNLQLRINELDKETQKQLELLYNANFQIQQMENKISKIKGDEIIDNRAEYEEKIKELEELLEGKTVSLKNLDLALHRLDLEMRQGQRIKEKLTKDNEDLSAKLNDINVDQASLDKSVAKVQRQKEEAVVQLNMLRLRVEKLTAQYELKCDEVIQLENRREQLSLSLQERMAELEQQIASMRVQVKVEQEARHQAIVELADRKKRSEGLEAKYNIIMKSYNLISDEPGKGDAMSNPENFQANFIITFASEREQIIRRGDEVEEEVKAAIKQLRMLEKQMQKLNIQTDAYKKGFQVDDPELEAKKKSLEDQLRVALERLNSKKAQALQAQEEKDIMDRTYNQKQDAISSMQNEINKMQPLIERFRSENDELREKMKRANIAMKKARDNVRKEDNVSMDSKYPASVYEMNVELSMHKQKINNLVIELTKLSDGNREIETKLDLALSQMGLHMQHSIRPPSSNPSGSASVRSGASFRSITSSNSESRMPQSARRNYNNRTVVQPNARQLSPPSSARRSNASKYSVNSNSSRKSSVSNASKGSQVSLNVHQIEFPQ